MNDYKRVGEEISKLNKVLVVSDIDLDGISSAVQMKHILDLMKKEYRIHFRIREELRETKKRISKFISENDYDGVILLDTPMDDKDLIEIAERNKNIKIVYIDHHKRKVPDNIPDNLIYFDVRALYNLSISTSNIVYKIGKALFNEEFKKYSLIASIGSIGDWTFDKDDELLKDFSEYYPSLYINQKYISISFIQYFMFFIFSNQYKILENSDKIIDPKEFIDSLDSKNIIKRINKFIKSINKLKVVYKDEILEVYESKNSTGLISTFISAFKPNKIIIVYTLKKEGLFKIFRRDKKIFLSMRCQNPNFDAGKFLSEFAKKHGTFAGGHPQAAGGLIYKKDLDKLIEEIKKIINNSK